MAGKTGRPGDPAGLYQGVNGPRISKPRKKPKTKIQQQTQEIMDGLFNDPAEEEPKPYTGKMGPRSTPPRKKVFLAPSWTQRLKEMEESGVTMEDFVKGLSPEELARGQVMIDGHFRGAPPKWVPQEFYHACVRELMRRGKQLYQENYLQAIEAMTAIATNGMFEAKDRIKAAQFVIERIEGKVPEKLEIGVDAPWQQLLRGIVVDVPDDAPMRTFAEAERVDEA